MGVGSDALDDTDGANGTRARGAQRDDAELVVQAGAGRGRLAHLRVAGERGALGRDRTGHDVIADGQRAGYQQGWRWGLWCGVVGGALLASIAWALWLTATAPNAAPPSARPTVATRL